MESSSLRGEAWEGEEDEIFFVSADLFRLDPRYEKRLRIQAEGGCWIWTGGKSRSGKYRSKYYGRIHPLRTGRGTTMLYTHRHVYTLLWGRIPLGWEVHHDCRNSLCCNPNHLIAVDPDEHDILHGYVRQYAF